jgi:hypothetical protein
MQCEDCRFYQKVTLELGECRRAPPRLMDAIIANSMTKPDGDLGYQSLDIATRFPVVFCEDWCGIFEARNTAEP